MTSTVLVQSISCAELTCEWKNCRETFANRLDFLSHITRRHVAPFQESEYCMWEGCEGWRFDQMEHLQLHLSIHAYHHQIMHAGYKIMASTSKYLRYIVHSFSNNNAKNRANSEVLPGLFFAEHNRRSVECAAVWLEGLQW